MTFADRNKRFFDLFSMFSKNSHQPQQQQKQKNDVWPRQQQISVEQQPGMGRTIIAVWQQWWWWKWEQSQRQLWIFSYIEVLKVCVTRGTEVVTTLKTAATAATRNMQRGTRVARPFCCPFYARLEDILSATGRVPGSPDPWLMDTPATHAQQANHDAVIQNSSGW